MELFVMLREVPKLMEDFCQLSIAGNSQKNELYAEAQAFTGRLISAPFREEDKTLLVPLEDILHERGQYFILAVEVVMNQS
jgi:hypothetical protein